MTCDHCRFSRPLPDGDHFSCRRQPPVAIFNHHGTWVSDWPTTEATDWCGEYQPIQMQVRSHPRHESQ